VGVLQVVVEVGRFEEDTLEQAVPTGQVPPVEDIVVVPLLVEVGIGWIGDRTLAEMHMDHSLVLRERIAVMDCSGHHTDRGHRILPLPCLIRAISRVLPFLLTTYAFVLSVPVFPVCVFRTH